jgi:hypothetical protein
LSKHKKPTPPPVEDEPLPDGTSELMDAMEAVEEAEIASPLEEEAPLDTLPEEMEQSVEEGEDLKADRALALAARDTIDREPNRLISKALAKWISDRGL